MRKRGWIAAGMFLVLLVMTNEYAAGAEQGDSLVVTLAGVPGNGRRDGIGREARFAGPMGMDVKGEQVILADTDNNQIRSYQGGRVVTLAGKGAEQDDYRHDWGGYRDTYGDQAWFYKPSDCAVLEDGRIAIADQENHSIRILEKNQVYTIGGTGEAGYQERENRIGQGQASLFHRPSGVASGPDGTIYVADTGNHCIRAIRRDGSTYLVAGRPGEGGYEDGDAENARFMEPFSVAAGEDGALYVADLGNQRIRKIQSGQVMTLAGSGTVRDEDTGYLIPAGQEENTDGSLYFCYPQGICMAGQVVIVADTGNHRICAVGPEGYAAVIAGAGEAGFQDGSQWEAEFRSPGDVAWSDGKLYISDSGNSTLRVMDFDPEKWQKEAVGEE